MAPVSPPARCRGPTDDHPVHRDSAATSRERGSRSAAMPVALDCFSRLPILQLPFVGFGPLLPASLVAVAIGLAFLISVTNMLSAEGWAVTFRGMEFFYAVQTACWLIGGFVGLVMAESSTVTLDFPRRELTVRRYRALLAMCCAVGRTTVPFSSFVAVELRPACCGGAPWRAAQEVFLVADHPVEGRREVAVAAKVSADEAEEELKRWKDFLTDIALSDFIS